MNNIRVPTLGPGPYKLQKLISYIKQFDRAAFLCELAEISRLMPITRPPGNEFHPWFPWVVSGLAAVVIGRGYATGAAPTREQVELACRIYFNLEPPHPPGEASSTAAMLAPLIYPQTWDQGVDSKHWVRPIALFDEAHLPADRQLQVIKKGWTTTLLGCTLAEFVITGFGLYAVARSGGRSPLTNPDLDEWLIPALGSRHKFNSIAAAQFVGDFEDLRKRRVETTRTLPATGAAREPYTFNPLATRPFVSGIDPAGALAPSVIEVALRTSVTGIYYEAQDELGKAFLDDLGYLFEAYVGRQLKSNATWEVQSEVIHDGPTVDWIAVLPNCVVLIECKSAMPARSVIEGTEAFTDGHRQLVKAFEQIDAVAAAIADGHSAFRNVPADRPVIGVAVTLGSFILAKDVIVEGDISQSVPKAAMDIGLLESVVTLGATELEEFVDRIRAADRSGLVDARGMLKGLSLTAPNTILKELWKQLRLPAPRPS